MTKAQLLKILTTIQNSEKFINRDILTFTAFLSDAEIEQHVWAHFRILPPEDKARALETARAVLA